MLPILFEDCNVPKSEQWATERAELNAMKDGQEKEELKLRLGEVVTWFNGINSIPAPRAGETAYTQPTTVPSCIKTMDLEGEVRGSEICPRVVSDYASVTSVYLQE